MLLWLLLPLTLLALVVYINFFRAKQREEIILTPNCLLLREPIVFIDGLQSPFYFLNYWNSIPHFMREHGYEVLPLTLPWRNENLRMLKLKAELDELLRKQKNIHIVYDESSTQLMVQPHIQNHPSIISTFCVRTKHTPSKNLLVWAHRAWTKQKNWNPKHLDLDLGPHQTAKAVLRHAIQLAESNM